MTELSPARSGFELKAGAKLADWRSIAASWHTGLERTVARCRGLDAPFCHNEHGNMHALMVGAEMSGLSTMREVVGSCGDLTRQCYLDGCFIESDRKPGVGVRWGSGRATASDAWTIAVVESDPGG